MEIEVKASGRIIYNMAKCAHCGTELISQYRWDFKFCKCGRIAVDGGRDYIKRIGKPEDIIELSMFEENNDA